MVRLVVDLVELHEVAVELGAQLVDLDAYPIGYELPF